MNILKFGACALLGTTLATAPASLFARDLVAQPVLNPNLQLARQLNQAFVQVAEDVSPAVVVIDVVQKASAAPHFDSPDNADNNQDDSSMNGFPPGFKRWFRQYEQNMPQTPEKTRGQGSGIIIRSNGYILTNRHVVQDAEKIEVRLKDGRVFPATVRGSDALADVAVVKIEAKNLPVAKLADSSKTRVGEFAIAIGAPFELDYSVTFGHISAKDRTNIPDPDDETRIMDQSFLQTDANINPGNSGGPLVNIEGEVVGINTLINGLHTGIGFAIPINMAKEVADKLITDGKYTRSWLGIGIETLADFPAYRDLVKGVHEGVVVTTILPNGPAAKSDLHTSDIITSVDGKTVVSSQQLKDEVRSKKIGQDVSLTVYRMNGRSGHSLTVLVKAGELMDTNETTSSKDNPKSGETASGDIGLTVDALTRDLADKFGVDMKDGVIVTQVDKSGLVARNKLDLKRGDIITSIDQKPVKNLKQFRDAVKKANTKRGVILNWISKDGTAKFDILKEGDE
jgi:serine protease Do